MLFGTAGIPISTKKRNSVSGIERVRELGLDSMELEFVRGVNMGKEKAKEVAKAARENNVVLSVHAPYYINLASEEKKKIEASKQRILRSCERGHHLGAKYIVFHAAFYGKRTPEKTYEMVKKSIIEMQKKIKEKQWKVVLAPETTGRGRQFGSLDELLKLKKEAKCGITVDFAHLKARNNGDIDYKEVFGKLKNVGHIHAHFSGIQWSEKGEQRHLMTTKEDFMPLLKQIKKSRADITIINESPDPVGDSLKAKKLFKSLR